MTKELRCGDVVPGCDWHATAESESELLSRASEHARRAHGIEVTPTVVSKVKAAIRET